MANADFIKYMDDHEAELCEDIFALCRINSERTAAAQGAPFGEGPRAALSAACELARSYGFEANVLGDRVMVAEYGEGEAKLAILAHLDVVPAGTGWTKCEPYAPVREGDTLYGRGVADDKGPAVAALYALRCVKELGVKLSSKVQLILGSAEETGSEDVDWYLKNYKMPPMVFTPDGDFPVVNTEKGRAPMLITAPAFDLPAGPAIVSLKGGTVANAVPGEAEAVLRFVSEEDLLNAITFASFSAVTFDYEKLNDLDIRVVCHGVAAHASLPEDGENAACGLINMLLYLNLADCAGHDALRALHDAIPYGDYSGEAFGGACEDVSGALTVNLGIIDYSAETGLRAVIDMRVPVSASSPELQEKLQAALGTYAGVEMKGYSEPHIVPAESDFVKTLLKIYADYTGLPAEPIAIGGGTYVHDIEGGVAFGCTMPGRKPKMHEPDENMPVSDLKLSAAMFAQAIADICG